MTQIKEFFDPQTWTLTYVVWDDQTRDAVVIDPVLDYDVAASVTQETSARAVIDWIRSQNLNLHLILETHAHADHVSASQVFKREFPRARVGIGAQIQKVQAVFKDVFHLSPEFPTDGSQFDLLFRDGEKVKAGSLEFEVVFTPGHTPACAAYLVDGHLFVGDSIFMPDSGTGRCDFPAGSAEDLYHSIHEKIYRLPDSTKIFVGHDYQPQGRPLQFRTTVGEQKKNNIQLKQETTREEFIQFRRARDLTLSAPRLLLPSVQINIDAGRLPKPESNGVSYLKIPIRSGGSK